MSFIRLTDIRVFASPPELSIRDVLSRFNELDYPFHVVLDKEGRLSGTVTDGDIRRGLLNGAALDDPISVCMNRNSLCGKLNSEAENAAHLDRVSFLPIVDEGGIVVELLLRHSGPIDLENCLIMAGGRGERLGHQTKTTPKPLVAVNGTPMLESLLRRLESANVRRIFISVHYLAEKIEAFLESRENIATIELLREQSGLGTAGALGFLPKSLQHPILVINADVVSEVDFLALHNFHITHGFDATLAVANFETKVPYGVVRQNEEGLFECIEEKPVIRNFVAAGIYYLSPGLCSMVRNNKPIDMPDLLNRGRDAGLKIGLFPLHEYWRDVGRPEDIEAAEKDLKGNDPKPSSQHLKS